MPVSAFEPLKILQFLPEIDSLKSGGIGRPVMGLLYPSMFCNQGCSYCHDLWRHSPKAFMPLPVMKEVLEDMYGLGCRGVELCGGGEPLVHPQILELVEYGQNLGLKFGVLTNLAMRNDALIQFMADHFSYVRVSVDYMDAAKYAKERSAPERQYHLMRENIVNLVKLRAANNPSLKVSVKATVYRQTSRDVADILFFAFENQLDSVQVKKAEDTVKDGLDADATRKSQIVEALEYWKSSGKKADLPTQVIWNFGDKAVLEHRCWISQIHIFVSTDGSVELCCYGHGRHEQHGFGNVNTSRLRDIWGSNQHRLAWESTDPAACNRFSCRFVNHMQVLDSAVEDGQPEFV